jgi:hypothetical protein
MGGTRRSRGGKPFMPQTDGLARVLLASRARVVLGETAAKRAEWQIGAGRCQCRRRALSASPSAYLCVRQPVKQAVFGQSSGLAGK